MYVDLARENELNSRLEREAHNKGEKFKRFVKNCFKQDKEPTSQDITDKRVTLAGHGTLTTLGDNKSVSYTPEQLVNLLTQQSSLTKLPTSVKELDLIACDIGLRPTADKESYLEQFARLLNQKVGYEQVQVRGFQHSNEQNQYQVMMVSSSGKVMLLDETQKNKFNQLKRDEELLNKQLKANIVKKREYPVLKRELIEYKQKLAEVTHDYNYQKTRLNEKELRELENEQGPKSLQFLKLTHNIRVAQGEFNQINITAVTQNINTLSSQIEQNHREQKQLYDTANIYVQGQDSLRGTLDAQDTFCINKRQPQSEETSDQRGENRPNQGMIEASENMKHKMRSGSVLNRSSSIGEKTRGIKVSDSLEKSDHSTQVSAGVSSEKPNTAASIIAKKSMVAPPSIYQSLTQAEKNIQVSPTPKEPTVMLKEDEISVPSSRKP